ncbi:hypothetical protein [Spirosoma jeollabukense]
MVSVAGATYLGQESGRSANATPNTNKGEKVKATYLSFVYLSAISPYGRWVAPTGRVHLRSSVDTRSGSDNELSAYHFRLF